MKKIFLLVVALASSITPTPASYIGNNVICEQKINPPEELTQQDLKKAMTDYSRVKNQYNQARENYEKTQKKLNNTDTKKVNKKWEELSKKVRILTILLTQRGRYNDAEGYLRDVLQVTEKHYGKNDKKTADIMTELGHLLITLEQYGQAKNYLEKALKIKEEKDKGNILRRTIILGGLVTVCKKIDLDKKVSNYVTKAKSYTKKLQISSVEKHYGKNNIKTAEVMERLGLLYQEQENYQQAEEYLKRALKITENHYGKNDRKTAKAMERLGLLYQEQENYQQAEEYLKRALKITENHYGKNDIKTAEVMERLGLLYQERGSYSEAKRCYEMTLMSYKEPLKIKNPFYGHTNSKIVKILEKLACTSVHLNEYEKAKNYLEQVEINQLEVVSLELLGGVYLNLDEYNKSKDCFKRALNLNPESADAMQNYGALLKNCKQYKQAKYYLEKALKIKEKNDKEDTVRIVTILENLAEVCRALNEYKNAEKYAKKGLGICTKFYGKNYIKTADLKASLWNIRMESGEYDKAKNELIKTLEEAKNQLIEALKIKEEKEKGDTACIVMILENLVKVCKRLREDKEASQYVDKAMEYIEEMKKKCMKYYDKNPVAAADAMTQLGHTLIALGQYKEAKQYFEEVRKIKDKKKNRPPLSIDSILEELVAARQELNHCVNEYGDNHVKTAEATERLGLIYEQQKMYQEAKTYYKRTLQIKKNCKKEYKEIQKINPLVRLGFVAFGQGKNEEAEEYIQEVLEIAKKHYHENHLEKADIMENVGLIYKKKGDDEDAKGLEEEKKCRKEEKKGCQEQYEYHYNEAAKYHDEGIKYHKEAEKYLLMALQMKKNCKKIQTVKTLKRLGSVSLDLQNNKKAEEYITEMLEITKEYYGENHVETADAMIFLGKLYQEQENYQKAEEYLKGGLDIMESLPRKYPIKIAGIAEALGWLYDINEKYPKAVTYYEKALKIKENYKNIETTATLAKLACVLAQLHQYNKAKKCLEEANSTQLKVESIKLLASISASLGDYNTAEESFKKGLKLSTPESPEAAELMYGYGSLLINLGKYEQAKNHLERALKIKEEKDNEDTFRIVAILELLVTVCKKLKENAAAIAYIKKVKPYIDKFLTDCVNEYGDNHIKTAEKMTDIGKVLTALGEYKDAENLLKKALNIYEVKNIVTHERAVAMRCYGRVLIKLKKYKGAKYLLEKALKIYEAKSTDVMHGYGGMGIKSIKYEKAKKYAEKVVEIKKTTYDGNIFRIAIILKDMVTVCKELKQYKEAQAYAEKALQITKDYFGHDNIKTADVMTSLANVLIEQGLKKSKERDYAGEKEDYRNAKKHLDDAIDIYMSNGNTGKRKKAQAMEHYGTVLYRLSDLGLAEIYLSYALDIYKQCPEKKKQRAILMVSLGNLSRKQGKYESAKEYLAQALPIIRSGNNDTKTAKAYKDLGCVLGKLGLKESNNAQLKQAEIHLEKAETYLKEALRIYMSYCGNELGIDYSKKLNIKIMEIKESLGDVLRKLGEYQKAKEHLEEVRNAYNIFYGPTHIKTARVMGILGTVLIEQRNYAEAKQYLAPALKIYQTHIKYGESHPQTTRVREILVKIPIEHFEPEIEELNQNILLLQDNALPTQPSFNGNHALAASELLI